MDVDTKVTPLAGLRVLDFTAMMAGPYCARWLSDLGAEVIKIEPPEGDHMRTRPPLREGHSSFFGHMNAGKKALSLDLKHPKAVEIVKRLVGEADVVLEAFRPGVMTKLGLGAEALRALNPRLVYCSISGFGQKGESARRPAYAAVVHASAGYYMANFDYQDGAAKPQNSAIPMADMLTAIFSAMAIQTALLERTKTGMGRTIDINLMDSIMNVLSYEFQVAQFPQPARRPLYKPLKAKDGFVIVVPVNHNNFKSVCACTGHPEWLDDPVLNSDAARITNWDEYLRRIELWTQERSAEDCERLMTEAGVPCSRYRRMDEVIHDPQFAERGSFSDVHDAVGGFKTLNLPFMFDGRKPQPGAEVPELGADTASVLQGVLGLSAADVDALRSAGVFGA